MTEKIKKRKKITNLIKGKPYILGNKMLGDRVVLKFGPRCFRCYGNCIWRFCKIKRFS